MCLVMPHNAIDENLILLKKMFLCFLKQISVDLIEICLFRITSESKNIGKRAPEGQKRNDSKASRSQQVMAILN